MLVLPYVGIIHLCAVFSDVGNDFTTLCTYVHCTLLSSLLWITGAIK